MRYTVVTSFSPSGWELYGKNFVDTFKQHWPEPVHLICAWEGQAPRADLNGFDLMETEPARSFYARHQGDPIVAGKVPHPNWPWGKKWKTYNFKFDAWRFSHKVFALTAAARFVEGGKLYWLDGDTYTKEPVSLKLLDDVLPDDCSISYLPRPDYTHSECGFMGFNLEHLETRAFLQAFEDTYATDDFFNIETWHDSFVFDTLVARYRPKVFHLKHNSRAQPFDHSVLGQYMTHLKGRRKHGEAGWQDGAEARQ